MKILLFGSTGLLGTHLFREFASRDWVIFAPQRTDINLFDLSQVNNFVGPWLARHPDGVVVYAAGYTEIAKCDANPGTAQHLNVVVPFLLANLCSRVNGRFVYFSSDQVFMDDRTSSFYQHHEGDDLDGVFRTTQVYGRTKADAETFLRRYARSMIIRTSWLFGQHPTRWNFVRDVVAQSIAGNVITALTDYVACPSYAPDVAYATGELIEDPTTEGTYHAVNGPPVSRLDMAQTIVEVTGLTAQIQAQQQANMLDWVPRNPNGGLKNNRGPQLRPWTNALREYLKTMPELSVSISA